MLRGVLPLAVVEGVAAAAEIGAGTEAAPRTRHEHDADRVVRVHLVEQTEQLLEHGGVHRIEAVGAVQGDGEDPVVELCEQGFEGHRATIAARGRQRRAAGPVICCSAGRPMRIRVDGDTQR
jgi:hypothetical protein